MPSSEKTVLKKLLAQHLYRNGYSLDKIAEELFRLGLKNDRTGEKLSDIRIDELIEGINKQRSSGRKTPIK
jgi:hypothetical protein